MVQLSTTYDQDLKRKVFVLKGEEAYARTTDTVMNVIEFDDTYHYRTHMRVGLEFTTYRMIGDDSYLNIFLNGDILNEKPIPWVEYPDEHTYDEFDYLDWDLDSRTLTWGKNNDPNTGLILPYEEDQEFYVKFYGNKQCLMSESKHYNHNKRVPTNFDCSINVTSAKTSYVSGNVDLSVTFTCNNDVELEKTVKIFDDETLLREVACTKDVAETVTLTGLSDGLHSIWAVFEGDSESTPTSTEYQISMGYDVSVDYPSTIYSGETVSITVTVLDYFSNPVPNIDTLLKKYEDGSWSICTNIGTTNSNGVVSLTSNGLIDENPFKAYCGNYVDSNQYTTTVIYPTTINKVFPSDTGTICGDGSSTTATLSVSDELGNRIERKDIPFKITTQTIDGTTITHHKTDATGTLSIRYDGERIGNISCDVESGGLSTSYIIEDVIQYLTTNREISKNITGFTKVTNGWSLNLSGTITAGIRYTIEKVLWEFDVVQSDGTMKIGEGEWSISCNANDHVQVTTTSNWITIIVNGVTQISRSETATGMLKLINTGVNPIILNNIKVKRVR